MDVTEKKPFINALLDNYLDSSVYQDILKTYSKETISFVGYGNLSITNMSLALINQVQLTETEISPFHKHDIDCEDKNPTETMRMPSLAVFDNKKIDFADLQRLLIRSFSPNGGSRPYPSAGGFIALSLWSFCFRSESIILTIIWLGCYHFRPVSKKLQLINPCPCLFFMTNSFMDI